MTRVSHDTWATIVSVLYLGLMTNLLLVVGCLPVVVLLVTTDPALSWPLLAAAAPLCAPALVAAFAVFREHGQSETRVVRGFVRAWRRGARKGLALGTLASAALVVLLVDIRVLSDTPASVVLVPVLLVLAVAVLATTAVALVAVSEAPDARLGDILRSSVYLAARRWYLSALTLAVLALQIALFTGMPAFALGLTAAPALYVAWANGRYILRPVLDLDEVLV